MAVEAIAVAVGEVAKAGGKIFGSKQERLLEVEKQKNARTQGILQIKQNQQNQELERKRQQTKLQIWLLVIGFLLLLAVMGVLLYYKTVKK